MFGTKNCNDEASVSPASPLFHHYIWGGVAHPLYLGWGSTEHNINCRLSYASNSYLVIRKLDMEREVDRYTVSQS